MRQERCDRRPRRRLWKVTLIGSSSASAPASRSCLTATATNDFVIDAIG